MSNTTITREELKQALRNAGDSNILCREALAHIEKLEFDVSFLDALQACGVDNWCGYDDAQEMMG